MGLLGIRGDGPKGRALVFEIAFNAQAIQHRAQNIGTDGATLFLCRRANLLSFFARQVDQQSGSVRIPHDLR